jgi:hypothetical protein
METRSGAAATRRTLCQIHPLALIVGEQPSFSPEVLMTDKQKQGFWPITLQQVEAAVSAHLGVGRVPGNRHNECFSRQVSMYLANHLGGWSTPQIGRFYNGRHHTTVLYAIEKIERLRKRDASIDALLEMLSGDLRPTAASDSPNRPLEWSNTFLDALAERILRRVASG